MKHIYNERGEVSYSTGMYDFFNLCCDTHDFNITFQQTQINSDVLF